MQRKPHSLTFGAKMPVNCVIEGDIVKLHLGQSGHLNTFTGYGSDHVLINGERHEQALVLTPTQIHPTAGAFNELNASHFDALRELNPEVVLLGTGTRIQFPHPRLYQSLTNAQIGVEVMDTPAACRTYNILMQEGRQVVALILL